MPERRYPLLRIDRSASEYSLSCLNAASLSSSSNVGVSPSTFRVSTAALTRPVSHAEGTMGSSTSSRRVLPLCFTALVTFRYGVASATAKA